MSLCCALLLPTCFQCAGQAAGDAQIAGFRATLAAHLEVVHCLSLLAAYTGKAEDSNLQQAQEALLSAQHACGALTPGSKATAVARALVMYAAAMYAITVNDLSAAAAALDTAAASLSGASTGVQNNWTLPAPPLTFPLACTLCITQHHAGSGIAAL